MTAKEFVRKVEKIVKALNVEKNLVGVKYARRKNMEAMGVKTEEERYTVCGGILEAAEGKIIALSQESCSCPGGRYYLGLVQEREVPLGALVEGEKLWCDRKTAFRAVMEAEKIARPPYALARSILLYPIKEETFHPDLVLMLVNAEQASRLIILNQFWDGKTPPMEMGHSLCWSTITYPFVSGNFNISVGDISARRMEKWDPNLMVASIPVERINGIADAVDRSTAGTAETSEEFKKAVEIMRTRKT